MLAKTKSEIKSTRRADLVLHDLPSLSCPAALLLSDTDINTPSVLHEQLGPRGPTSWLELNRTNSTNSVQQSPS
jgi:hypothetical protein